MGVVRDGGTGIGVNPNGYYFPFVKEVAGAERLFADMYVGHRVESVVLPLRLSYIQGFTQPGSYSPSNRADLIVVDADDNVIFNSNNAADYRYNEWSDRFTIHEWISATAVCRIVQHTGQNDLEDVLTYPFEQTLTDAVLDERVSELWPKGVTKIIANGTDITGDLEILQGYNFQTTLDSVVRTGGQPRVNSVSVSAEAGVGEGLAPGCEEAIPLLRRINQVGPTEKGAFVLSASACLSVIRPATFVSNYVGSKAVLEIERDGKSGVLLKNNCLPCCSCDDFVNTYKGIRQLYDRYAVLGDRANVVRDRHAENVNRWLAQKECRESLPIKTGLIPYKMGLGAGVKAVVGVCNASGVCKGEVEADITFEIPETANQYDEKLIALVHPDSIFSYVDNGLKPQRYALSGKWPEYKVKWDMLESQALAKVKFDMYLTRGGVIEYDSTFDILNKEDGDKLFDARVTLTLRNRKEIPLFTSLYQPFIDKHYNWQTKSFPFAHPPILFYDLDFKITCPDPDTGDEMTVYRFETGYSGNTPDSIVKSSLPGIAIVATKEPSTQLSFAKTGIPPIFIGPGSPGQGGGLPGLNYAPNPGNNFLYAYTSTYGMHPTIEMIQSRQGRLNDTPFYVRYSLKSNSTSILPMSLWISTNDLSGNRTKLLKVDRPIYDDNKQVIGREPFFSGHVFVDAYIPPIIQTKIYPDDYIKMNVAAKLNSDPLVNGTASETAGLKDIP